MGDTPRCTVVVVTYNSAAEVSGCLRALRSQVGVETDIVVVDNASRDGSADLVASEFPHVRLIRNERNVGFARANNQVLATVESPYFALVNPDTVPPPSALHAGISALEREPAVGIVGLRLVYPGGRLQASSHAFLGLWNLFEESTGLLRFRPGWTPGSSPLPPGFSMDRRSDVDWVRGAFLVGRAEICRSVGVLDPDFFMYGEEMEWCWRIRKAGWRIVYLPEPAVVHIEGASSRPLAGPMYVENLKGRLRFFRKHRGAGASASAAALIALSVIPRWLVREAQVVLAGARAPENVRLQRDMFRAAMAWIALGFPLTPPPRSVGGDAA